MGKGKKPLDILAPTPEQQRASFMVEPVHDRTATGGLNLRGTAYRRTPMIKILAASNVITDGEHKALAHYRHHADIADRSLVRDSLCIQRGGSGCPTITTLNAVRIVNDIERAVGSLLDILRAVAVYDRSLSEWAMHRHGALEQRRERGGKTVVSMEPRQKALRIARLEIKLAARRVEAEIGAGHLDRKIAA